MYMYVIYVHVCDLCTVMYVIYFVIIDRLTMKGLLVYLMNDENHVFDPVVFDRSQDMNKPFNHYFINSSHNTYLNGMHVT